MPMEFLDRFMSGSKHLIRIPLIVPKNPQEISAGNTLVAPYFPVGDDLFWGKSSGITPQVELRILVDGVTRADALEVQLNGRTIGDKRLQNGVLTLWPPADLIEQGNNQIAVTLRPGDAGSAKVCDIQLHVGYLSER